MKTIFLKILFGFAQIADGIIYLLSLTFICSGLALKVAESLARERYKAR